MPRITSEKFLDSVYRNEFLAIKLKGIQNGSFCLMLENAECAFILENSDGSVKEYPKVDHALLWLKRQTGLKEITVDIELWRDDL